LALVGAGVTIASASLLTSNKEDAPNGIAPAVVVQMDDPISGDWEGAASSDAQPDDIPLVVHFEMDEDSNVVGSFVVGEDEAPFGGSYDAEEHTLTGSVTSSEIGNWELTLSFDEDDFDTLSGGATESNSGQTADITLERSEE